MLIKKFKNIFIGFKPTFWSTFFSLISFIILIILGTWQLYRLDWKTDLISERNAGFKASPLTLSQPVSDLKRIYWMKVKVTGRFDHENELFLAARSLRGNVGFHVITPFKVSDTNSFILINRGWVSKEKKDAKKRVLGLVKKEVDLIGIANPGFKKGPFSPSNNSEENIWFYIDFNEMSKKIGIKLEPFIIDSIESAPGGFPIGGQTRLNIPNDHLQYAITWYSLAIVLFFVWFMWNKRRLDEIKSIK